MYVAERECDDSRFERCIDSLAWLKHSWHTVNGSIYLIMLLLYIQMFAKFLFSNWNVIIELLLALYSTFIIWLRLKIGPVGKKIEHCFINWKKIIVEESGHNSRDFTVKHFDSISLLFFHCDCYHRLRSTNRDECCVRRKKSVSSPPVSSCRKMLRSLKSIG